MTDPFKEINEKHKVSVIEIPLPTNHKTVGSTLGLTRESIIKKQNRQLREHGVK